MVSVCMVHFARGWEWNKGEGGGGGKEKKEKKGLVKDILSVPFDCKWDRQGIAL